MHCPSSRPAVLGSLQASRALAILMLVVLEFAWIGTGVSAVGRPIYPDLITSPPSGLYIERGPDSTYLLRFANTAVNLGGRLEITVGTGTRDIYQNVFDKYVGGNRVIHQKVGADLIYHPHHNHFHFEGFASYELLKRDSRGFYRETSRTGSKTSFCILDTLRIGSDAPVERKYDGCGATVQGLSAGWGDTYIASLFGQWIELGSSPLVDGSYAIRSTADPDNKLMELNDFNNVGVTYFTVQNGRLSIDGIPPLCSVEAASGGTTATAGQANAIVGSTVALSCLRFGAREQVDIYWGSTSTDPRSTVTSSGGGAVFAQIQVPQSTLGVHYVIARGRVSGTQAAAVVNTIPSVSISPTRGIVGKSVQVTLRGFSASEQISVLLYKTKRTSMSVRTVTAASNGSATASFAIPAIPYGSHAIQAVGLSSGATAGASLVVDPSMLISPDEVDAGSSIGVSLRGFVAGETVGFWVGGRKTLVGYVVTSHSGSTTARTARLTVPDSVLPGEYTLTAVGDRSNSPITAQLTVTAPTASEDPAPTPVAESTASPAPSPTMDPSPTFEVSPTISPTESPTAIATIEPTATETATSTPTQSPNASPVAVAPPDINALDADANGSEHIRLDGTQSLDPDGGSLTYLWTIQVLADSGEPEVTVLDTDPVAEFELPVGEHTITLTVTDPLGATDSDEVVVKINPPPSGTPAAAPA